MSILVFDVLFCLALLGLAGSVLRARSLFSGIVLFIVFGLLLALAWARLSAPDLALTEAALGAGLVGALFLAAHRRLHPGDEKTSPGERRAWGAARYLVLAALAPVLYAACAAWLPPGAVRGEGLTGAAYEALPMSGVTNPVTAALLNYRAYDTLLELCVLLLAVLSVYALYPEEKRPAAAGPPPDEVLTGYVRAVLPVMVLVAGYILWAGSHRAGGAFQAGSILAGAGVLVLLTSRRGSPDYRRLRVRLALTAGFASFAGIGLVLLLLGGPCLRWPPRAAKTLIVAIESAATLSIALTLVLLFSAGMGLLAPAGPEAGRAGEVRS